MTKGITDPRSRKLLAGFIFLCIAVGAFADPARLDCEMPDFDFGISLDTQVVTHTFILRNTGDAAVPIAQVRSSCSYITLWPIRRSVSLGETGHPEYAVLNAPIYLTPQKPIF
jgi:hypothetical protein